MFGISMSFDFNYVRPLSIIFAQLVGYSDIHSGLCACHKTAAYEGVSSNPLIICLLSKCLCAFAFVRHSQPCSQLCMTILYVCSVVIYMLATTS